MNRRLFALVSVSTMTLALSRPAFAQDFSRPIETPTSGTQPYVTSYFDHDTTSGTEDYTCASFTYNGHKGTDIGIGGFPVMNAGSRHVLAPADGTVVWVNDGCYDECQLDCALCGDGFGNYVKLEHPDGRFSILAHLMTHSITVGVGDAVTCGQVLGKVGSSGNSSGPHLHFESRNASGWTSAFDPHQGACGSSASAWVGQNGYQALADSVCATDPVDAPEVLDAAFITETVFDGTAVDAGATFVKTWTLRNDGNTTWTDDDGFTFAWVSDETFGDPPASAGLGDGVAPGETHTFAITLTAPETLGLTRGYWRMHKDGVPFGVLVWVEVDVQAVDDPPDDDPPVDDPPDDDPPLDDPPVDDPPVDDPPDDDPPDAGADPDAGFHSVDAGSGAQSDTPVEPSVQASCQSTGGAPSAALALMLAGLSRGRRRRLGCR